MNDQLFDLLGDDGEIYGPYRVAELQKLIDVNRADGQSQIRESGTENQWRAMETILPRQETSSDSLDSQKSDVLVTGDIAEGLYDLIGNDGVTYGPYRLSELQELLDEDRANWQSQVRESGTENQWRALEAVIRGYQEPHVDMDELVTDIPRLNIGRALSDGTMLFKQYFGVLVGAFAIFILIMMVVSAIPFANLLVQTPLMAGLIILGINLKRTGSGSVKDLFEGFDRCFPRLIGIGLVQAILFFAAAVPGVIGVILGLISASAAEAQQQEPGVEVVVPIVSGVLLSGIMVCVVMPLTIFAPWLAADKDLSFGESFRVAIKVGWKNLFPLSILMGVGLLSCAAGFSMCCIGLFVSGPWAITVMAMAYEQLFTRERVLNDG